MQTLINLIKKIYRYRYTIRSYAARDIRSRYSGSLIGIFWSVIHPLVMVAVYSIIFSFIFKARVGDEYAGSNYSVWLLCGLIPWNFFNETLQRSSTILIENKNIVTKSIFPSEILPIGLMFSSLLNHVIGLCIIVVALFLFTGGLPVSSLFVLAYFVPFIIMMIGLSWLLASVNVFIRDVGQLTAIGMNLWFFLTPIIYPASIVPERFRQLLMLNPAYYVVEGYRSSLLLNAAPEPAAYFMVTAFSVTVFAVGGYVFRRLKPYFPDEL